MSTSMKWWGDVGDVGIPCAEPEKYRARVGTYTMRLMHNIDGFVSGNTCSDEHFEFAPEVRENLRMHICVLLEMLRTGEICRRPGAEQSDVDFQRFMAVAARSAPRRGKKGK